MTKLPDCPKCGEDELWLQHFKGGFCVRCYLCGWDSGLRAYLSGHDINAIVADAVAAATAPGSEAG